MKQKYLKSMMLIFIISVSVFLFNMCSNKTKGTVIKTDNVEEEKDYNNNPEYESDTDESAEDEGNVEEYYYYKDEND